MDGMKEVGYKGGDDSASRKRELQEKILVTCSNHGLWL